MEVSERDVQPVLFRVSRLLVGVLKITKPVAGEDIALR